MARTGTKQHLILVANARTARFFSRLGDHDPLTPLPTIHNLNEPQQAPGEHGNHAGHVRSDGRPGGVTLAPHTDSSHKSHAQFATQLAGLIDRAIGDEACDELFLAASSPFLGDLRAALSAQADKRLIGSVDVDLTSFGLTELEQRLADQLPHGRALQRDGDLPIPHRG